MRIPQPRASGLLVRACRAAGPALILICLHAASARAQYPDFDLRVECARTVSGPADGMVRLPATVILRSTPADPASPVGARAWSLSLATSGPAKIVEATTDETEAAPAPQGLLTNGYEETVLTSGPGNEGVVSAVILSLSRDVYLPASGDSSLLKLVVECTVPASGCASGAINFVDGLVGTGQPVKNVITYAEGTTRRDDGGPLDNDADAYEAGEFFACVAPIFIRSDANDDGTTNLSDSVAMLKHLFLGGNNIPCLRSADVTDDDLIDLADAVHLLNHLFASGPPPAPPYPRCWVDPDPGTLPCAMAKACG